MPVPSKMADLSTLAASNSPAGSDAIGNSLDDYIRGISAVIRSTNANSSATLAAASTVDLGTSDGEAVSVTGSATISSFGTVASGIKREVTFVSAGSVITNSAAIALANSANITVAAGDTITLRSQGSGNWKQVGALRPTPAIGDVVNLTATLATLQPALGYVPVNRAGDTMSGNLAVVENVNTSASITVTNQSALGSTFAGYYFGNDVASGTAAYILKNSSGNSSLGGSNSLNIVNAQASNLDLYSGGLLGGRVTSTGILQVPGALQPTGNSAVPASLSGACMHLGGFTSPTAGRTAFGDGTGWVYQWSRRASSAYVDVMTLTDTGALTIFGAFNANSVTAVTVTATSDARLKKNIVPLAPRDLSSIPYSSWNFIKSGVYGQGHVAQDVEAVAPEYVHEHDDVKSVDQAGVALEKLAYIEALLKRRGLWE